MISGPSLSSRMKKIFRSVTNKNDSSKMIIQRSPCIRTLGNLDGVTGNELRRTSFTFGLISFCSLFCNSPCMLVANRSKATWQKIEAKILRDGAFKILFKHPDLAMPDICGRISQPYEFICSSFHLSQSDLVLGHLQIRES